MTVIHESRTTCLRMRGRNCHRYGRSFKLEKPNWSRLVGTILKINTRPSFSSNRSNVANNVNNNKLFNFLRFRLFERYNIKQIQYLARKKRKKLGNVGLVWSTEFTREHLFIIFHRQLRKTFILPALFEF